MTRLAGAHYSRLAESALERGEQRDPESIDVDAAPFVDELRRREERRRAVERYTERVVVPMSRRWA